MKVAIVIFVIGEKYIISFNNIFKNNLTKYCEKYNYDLIILNEYIKHEENMVKKKFYWQRMLIPNKFKEYDYLIFFKSLLFNLSLYY